MSADPLPRDEAEQAIQGQTPGRCSRCQGILIADNAAEEWVCFTCSRRFQADGSTTVRAAEQPGRSGEQIAGIRF